MEKIWKYRQYEPDKNNKKKHLILKYQSSKRLNNWIPVPKANTTKPEYIS